MRRSLTDVQPAWDSEGGKLDAFVNQLKNNAAVAMRTIQAKQGIQSMAFYLVVLKGPGENEGTEAFESTDNNRGCDYSFSSYSSRGSSAQKSHNTASYTC